MKPPHHAFAKFKRWWPQLIARDGRLTQELRLERASGGLGHLPVKQLPQSTTSMVCGYCSTGCSLDVHLRAGQVVGLTPSSDYPVNLGMACPKGWEAFTVLDSPQRATTPLLRRGGGGALEPIDWQTAMSVFVQRMRRIQLAHGPESVAFLGTGQLPTEELALLGALAKFGMQMRHGDGNTRQCMATSVVAYREAFGFDAPPYCYADLEQSDVIVLIGSNLCIAHPIIWQRVLNNRRRPQIVVIDPRKTETAMQATLHLAPSPKSDLVLLYGVARILIERGWIDRAFIDEHTAGFSAFADHVGAYDVARVAGETGVAPQQISRLAEMIHEHPRVSFWWTMGVNQSHLGVRTAQAIINLALMTGNIGRPGTGANSITGQCNAMGSRLFSNTTNLLGGRDFVSPADRRRVADILGIDASCIPSQPSWPYHRILEGVLRKQIRGLWIVGTNPAHSWINQHQLRDILGRLDFLVVQDMYADTETARMADLLLPAAGWGEKMGTFINSERRLGVIKKVAQAPGQALSDFAIFRLVAEYWGCGSMFQRWSTPEAAFDLLKHLSAGQPCDFSGVRDYQHLDDAGGIQWPYPAASSSHARREPAEVRSERRLFTDGRFYHPDEKARFLFGDPRPCPEPPSSAFPMLLLTGRGSAAQWHTQTRSRQSAVLRKLAPLDPYVEINPSDSERIGIRSGDRVAVISQRGRLRAKAVVTPTIQPGQVFMPMHYVVTNVLTHATFDPYSSQPAYKACAVRVEKSPEGRS
jgi:assimilatory nitrate reductase catalytic subunit